MSDLFIVANIAYVIYTLILIVPKLILIFRDADKSLQMFTYFAIMNLGISYYLLYKVVVGITE